MREVGVLPPVLVRGNKPRAGGRRADRLLLGRRLGGFLPLGRILAAGVAALLGARELGVVGAIEADHLGGELGGLGIAFLVPAASLSSSAFMAASWAVAASLSPRPSTWTASYFLRSSVISRWCAASESAIRWLNSLVMLRWSAYMRRK